MKRITLLVLIMLILSQACSLSGITRPDDAQTIPNQPQTQGQKPCGDGVCDGPENPQNCAQDCSPGVVDGGDSSYSTAAQAEDTNPPALSNQTPATVGIIYAEVELERTAGNGDCGIDPWYSPDCSSMKTWWGLDIKAVAETAVLIIPDGQDRWVVTNHPEVVCSYDIELNNFLPSKGEILSASIDFSPVPECSGEIEMHAFDVKVMGTHEELLELILSANPEEFVKGSCAGTGFSYSTNHLLYGWAAALSGDPLDLSFEINDSFKIQSGQYSFEIEIDTNPSPENRDHVSTIFEFMCVGSQHSSVMEPITCPWEQ